MTPNHSTQAQRADGGVVNDLTGPRKDKPKCLLFHGRVGWEAWRWGRCNELALQNHKGAPN